MRIDKWLKVSRIIKRREIAKELCLDGDIFINGKSAKPMSEVHPNDGLLLFLGKHKITLKVLEERTFAKKEEANKMFEIVLDEIIEKENDNARL